MTNAKKFHDTTAEIYNTYCAEVVEPEISTAAREGINHITFDFSHFTTGDFWAFWNLDINRVVSVLRKHGFKATWHKVREFDSYRYRKLITIKW